MILPEHTIAVVMVERFRVDAIEIAEHQYGLADIASRPRWAAVYAYVLILLRERAFHPGGLPLIPCKAAG
jgi:hypothetical protein